ncbi:Uma2 family endonuclease [Kovacikia minuta CCNUW1]|uniref:Uma2 family endonuclease n=1 Tax=Kovacikia minuta TaxID=2931930 RepID=UPI001CCE0527|nr:Uma2 family endonuclease [Kovacikia minuta]UBF24429.1 Uma2 family endonuclease [Kovacikia minuta CCNUW1]
MSSSPDLETLDSVDEEIAIPPTDLYSDEPPVESDLHLQQIILFLECLNWWWRDRGNFYASGNLTIYYSQKKIKSQDFRGPDFFVVLETECKPRKSWVVWDEDGKYPNVIVEILSNSTATVDKGLKKQLYQDTFRTPDYFWFDPNSLEFAGFHLLDGQYQPLQPNAQGHLWSQQLQLFLGVHDRKLRFFTPEGELIPSPREAAENESRQKEFAQEQLEREAQRAEREAQRAKQLAAKLRELGVDPDTI